jgi:uncharacterized protein YyaL (SSP411 family)
MPNHLVHENSPYLLQHANNPVDWYPWGEEALEKARKEDKPIFLSIGYAACHWCHVMAHESFEDPQTALIMNQHFVSIKVDREERPDLDSIYMNAVVAMTGQGGWPMSVFLTPYGEPFFGGTYFPPVRRYNMPSFREVLLSVSQAWVSDRGQIENSVNQVTGHLKKVASFESGGAELNPGLLDKAVMALAQGYDWKKGGWGQAPKFPQPMVIEFLLRRAVRGDQLALDMAAHVLTAMAKGGMYDVIGGGFARYSTDNDWLVPHFEKMLYDNVQLSRVYLYGYLLTGEQGFRRVCEETLGMLAREFAQPQGGFYSSLDADSEGQEGKYYIWSDSEIREALDRPQDVELFIAAYQVTPQGNFEGSNVLQRQKSDAELSELFHLPIEQVQESLAQIHTRLLQVREARVRPATDDKVLVSWNALALLAFSEAARYLNRMDYLEIAVRSANFLLDNLREDERLLRSWRKGKALHNAYLEDYAALALGLLSLYQSDPNPRWYAAAVDFAGEINRHFRDPQAGFFDTRDDHGELLVRPRDIQDNATPSGNALGARLLLELAAYSGKGEWRDQAESALASIQSLASRYPTAFGFWLSAIDFALAPVSEVAVLGDLKDERMADLVGVLWEKYRPNLVAACSDLPIDEKAPPLLDGRALSNEIPTAYVCHLFVCRQPVNSPDQLREQLEENA